MGKIYLAGKLNDGESNISEFGEELEDRGHEITFKWWDPELPKLPTPYLDYPETSTVAAVTMEEAVVSADTALILFPTATILGAAVEFGIGLGSQPQQPNRELLVVGHPEEIRQSVFYAHPEVIVLRGLSAIRERSWY